MEINKISIIIPIYNEEKTIDEPLEHNIVKEPLPEQKEPQNIVKEPEHSVVKEASEHVKENKVSEQITKEEKDDEVLFDFSSFTNKAKKLFSKKHSDKEKPSAHKCVGPRSLCRSRSMRTGNSVTMQNFACIKRNPPSCANRSQAAYF